MCVCVGVCVGVCEFREHLIKSITQYLLRLDGGLRPDIDKRFCFFCLLTSSELPAEGSLLGVGVAEDPVLDSSSTDSCTRCDKRTKEKQTPDHQMTPNQHTVTDCCTKQDGQHDFHLLQRNRIKELR